MLSSLSYRLRLRTLNTSRRHYLSPTRDRRELCELERQKKVEEKVVYERGLPEVTSVIKQMWMKVHPDKLNAYPLLRDANAESMKKLNGLIQYICAPQAEYHRPELIKLRFYVIQDSISDSNASSAMRVREVLSSIQLNGNDCRNGVKRQLITLFSKCNLSTAKDFRWPKAAWDVDWKRTIAEGGNRKSSETESGPKQLPSSSTKA